jgi:hypothetical protein
MKRFFLSRENMESSKTGGGTVENIELRTCSTSGNLDFF